jgi:hypothetical protein
MAGFSIRMIIYILEVYVAGAMAFLCEHYVPPDPDPVGLFHFLPFLNLSISRKNCHALIRFLADKAFKMHRFSDVVKYLSEVEAWLTPTDKK